MQVHDDRAIFQASPDELPAIDIHSLWPVPDATHACRETADWDAVCSRRENNATEAGAGRFEKPAPDARAAPPEAHESLIGRKTVAVVPLTGLSFLDRAWACQRRRLLVRPWLVWRGEGLSGASHQYDAALPTPHAAALRAVAWWSST